MSSGLDMYVHVVLGVEATKVDARETGVQVRAETMADMTDTRLCLRGEVANMEQNYLTTINPFLSILVSMVLYHL